MICTLLDTKTGEKVRAVSAVEITAYGWTDGNWSCDCNRKVFFGFKDNGLGICEGAKRFIVIDVEYDKGEPRYTLQELNADYPPEMLNKHGIEVTV